MRRVTFFILLAILAAATAFAQESGEWYYGKPIADIQFTGLIHVQKTEVEPLVRRFKGKAFDDTLWYELYNSLFSLECFESIEPVAVPGNKEKQTVIVRINVTEKPWIESIRVEGNKIVRVGEILDVVTLKKDDVYREYKAKLDVIAVKNLLVDKGFPGVAVSQDVEPGTKPGTLVWIIRISEGGKVTVKEIRFSGNTAFSASALKGKLSLKEEGFLQPGAFKEAFLEQDKGILVDYMQGRGYIDAKVVDVLRDYVWDEKDKRQKLVLTFVIAEGDKYLFGGFSFEGNRIFSTEKLLALTTHEVNTVVDYRRIKADKNRVDDLYYENGYIFNRIVMKSKRDEERKAVSYLISIEEHDRSHIENILLKGNDKTKDFVIMRELPLEVGDVFSKAKIMEGLRNLYNLQYFSAIIPEMVPGSAENLMDLTITVEEQSTADIQFGATLAGLGISNSSFPISALVKWNDRNFMGNGQDFKVDLNVSPDQQSVIFGFTEKWLFGKRLTVGTELSFSHKTLDVAQDTLAPIFDQREGDEYPPDPYATWQEYADAGYVIPDEFLMPIQNWEIALGLNGGYVWKTPVGDYGVGGGFSTGFELKGFDADKYRPYDYENRLNYDAWLYKNTIYARTYLNSLDIWYDPSNGYYTSLRATLSGLFDFELKHYLRLDWKTEGYLTLVDVPISDAFNYKLILGAHSGLSFILPQPGRPLAYGTEGLAIDGTFVGRGWMLGAQTGTQLWENWLELRTPIVPRLLSLDAFLDAAALRTQNGLLDIAQFQAGGDSVDDSVGLTGLRASNIAISSGFGIRFTLPQFPFRLYFAKRFYFDDSNKLNFVEGPINGLDFVIGVSLPLN
ncbi:MAG: outer membrane protein assembly factor BamA [Spirochaetes bacterium]|nr:outer membrane protein assembly factor BamA [Spirochaetota bacterium]